MKTNPRIHMNSLVDETDLINIVDEIDLIHIMEELANVCYEKARYLEEISSNEQLARAWTIIGETLRGLAEDDLSDL